MNLTINTQDPNPVYEQLVQQVEQAVLTGQLRSGDMLPSIRQLAADLAINPNTVAKAYQLLERNGVIVTAGRRGTFIHRNSEQNTSQGIETTFRKQVCAIVEDGLKQGMSYTVIQTIIGEVIKSFERR